MAQVFPHVIPAVLGHLKHIMVDLVLHHSTANISIRLLIEKHLNASILRFSSESLRFQEFLVEGSKL